MLTIWTDLATGGKSSHLPYGDIEQRQATFIESKYLPRNVKIRQPRNLLKVAIVEIFGHLVKRQEIEGADATFRFKSIKNGNRIVRAQYPSANADPDPEPEPEPEPDATGSHPSRILKHPQPVTRGIPAEAVTPNADPEFNIAHLTPSVLHRHYNAEGIQIESACSTGTAVLVDHSVMLKMHNSGITMPVPCNGPSDGPPQYSIPCTRFQAFLSRSVDDHNPSPNNGEPRSHPSNPGLLTMTPMPTPSPTPTATIKKIRRRGQGRV